MNWNDDSLKGKLIGTFLGICVGLVFCLPYIIKVLL